MKLTIKFSNGDTYEMESPSQAVKYPVLAWITLLILLVVMLYFPANWWIVTLYFLALAEMAYISYIEDIVAGYENAMIDFAEISRNSRA